MYLDTLSSDVRATKIASSVACTASSIRSGFDSSAISDTGIAISDAWATFISAVATLSVDSFATLSIVAAISFFLTSASIFRCSSALSLALCASTRSWTCATARSASCRTFSAWEPILGSCCCCVISSSVRSSSKLSGVAMRTRWITLRTMRAAAPSMRLASSSRLFFSASLFAALFAAVCARSRICRCLSRSLSGPPLPASCCMNCWIGAITAGGNGGIGWGLGPIVSLSVSSTGPSQGTFQPPRGGRPEPLFML
mmetsp:Transcript_95307/g.269713  ORF Transcript_95307/g.269713 Transcript_95307/m.269713 type:complete len:256 (+) Transcript_95307:1679-2446(+)